jgi:hypothetical protein
MARKMSEAKPEKREAILVVNCKRMRRKRR